MVGKRVNQRTVDRMFRDAPLDADRRRQVGEQDFENATFVGPIDFSNVRFKRAKFRGATFLDEVSFDEARFDELAEFACTTFEDTASFADAVFHCLANFEHREGEDRHHAGEATFRRWADFREAKFTAGASFAGALFVRRARFGGAIFEPGTDRGEEPVASFVGARFERARTFGPILVNGELSLDRTAFEGPVRIELSAPEVSCVATQFMGRTTLELRWATINLEDAEFAQPSIISAKGEKFELEDRPGRQPGRTLEDLHLGGSKGEERVPRVKSLQRANVGNLTLSELDLKESHFVGAHNLDGLRFESVEFDYTEGRFVTRRRMIAEENDKKVSRERLARTYRALRKGREDNKDEPGAADFYYGEMEMRRQAKREKGDPEPAILWLYRAVSGYGLRSSRALLCLLITVVGGAILFTAFSGFDPDQGFWKSLLFSAQSAAGIFRAPAHPDGVELNDEGHVYQMGVRLFGALFFGLALLALRGRVKR
jgi:uncharacterized protein YjbI with pentapeptide repeats